MKEKKIKEGREGLKRENANEEKKKEKQEEL